jgi:hypothetical protein
VCDLKIVLFGKKAEKLTGMKNPKIDFLEFSCVEGRDKVTIYIYDKPVKKL